MNASDILEADLLALLTDIRSYLGVTWPDEGLDGKLNGFILRGITYLNDIAGADQEYLVEGQARSLLFDYVRYNRAQALEAFWQDFRHELLMLRAAAEVAAYESPDV